VKGMTRNDLLFLIEIVIIVTYSLDEKPSFVSLSLQSDPCVELSNAIFVYTLGGPLQAFAESCSESGEFYAGAHAFRIV
jgi:hypothetical protein